jgi:N-acetylmuramoyl-L-alanine amidase CwlA
MEVYMYKYNCPGQWYGTHTGLRNVYVNSNLTDEEASSMAKDDIKKSSMYKDCAVTLLVKYKLTIESIKTYPDITKIPFSEPTKNIKKLSLD